MQRMKVGLVGCGRISGQYLENLVRVFSTFTDVVAACDISMEAAQARAQEFNISRVCTQEEMLADPQIELIVNLTLPASHYAINRAALEAGKHVYGEKPFTVALEEARQLLALASHRGRRIGGAPDTFLGAGLQTARKLIDEGAIGEPTAACAFLAMGSHTPRYYVNYRGPLFDMAPYYLTALVALLGPVRAVSGAVRWPGEEAGSEGPTARDPETTPANATGVLEFENGVLGTLSVTSRAFNYFPRLEIYGSEGLLVCNDPNMFGGPVFLHPRNGERRQVDLQFPYTGGHRGLGVSDMADALRTGRPHRASGDLCAHVLEVAWALMESGERGVRVAVESRVDRPTPFPLGGLSE